jgi:hypothetical protein
MIKGLAITPPILGRITIGKVVEKNGKRLPEKDDQFTITTQVQGKDGWIAHKFDEELRKTQANNKIRSIPIRLLFNEPDLNLRAEYCLFDRQSGRPMCTGNGETCRRLTLSGMETLTCPGPDTCELGKNNLCKPYGRLNVLLGEEDGDIGTFIFRTTGYNSIRTLAARLAYYQAASGNLLSCMALALKLRAKSTTLSHRTPIYYADITVPEGVALPDVIAQARQIDEARKQTGFNQQALDDSARASFANGSLEDTVEELPDIADEFFPATGEEAGAGMHRNTNNAGTAATKGKPSLKDRLETKSASLATTVDAGS